MIDFRVYSAAVYRDPQETTWENPMPYICLQVSGLRWRRYPDGREEKPRLPCLELVGAGQRSSYRYDGERENWVIQLISDDIVTAADPQRCELRSEGLAVAVPTRVALDAVRCHHWQRHCARLVADNLSPDPLRRLRVRAAICELLAVFIAAAEEGLPDDPAERLRRAIDQDQGFLRTIEALSTDLGYSGDHLRRLFAARFGVTPMQYRTERRMALAADLVVNSGDDIQVIAERLGFQHSSHFCTVYRQHFGTTPGRDIRRLRMP